MVFLSGHKEFVLEDLRRGLNIHSYRSESTGLAVAALMDW